MEQESWHVVLQQGHPQLDAALQMSSCPWVIALPIQERQLALEEGLYCQAVLFALHWSGGPGTPLTAFALAVPASACEGIGTDLEFVQVPLHHPGVALDEEAEELTPVGILLFSGGELGRLLETTPSNAHVLAFDELFPEGMPAVETLVEKVQHWDILAGPTTFSRRVLQGLPHIVRIFGAETSVAADDEGYHSAGQMDLALGHRAHARHPVTSGNNTATTFARSSR
eukprot:6469366-Amphidinium_carterae.3